MQDSEPNVYNWIQLNYSREMKRTRPEDIHLFGAICWNMQQESKNLRESGKLQNIGKHLFFMYISQLHNTIIT